MVAEPLEEWIQKAEQDFEFAQLGMRQPKSKLYDGICFHAQQCSEKYLKAFLFRHDLAFRKTHDLDELLLLCKQVDSTFNLLADLTPRLNPYSVGVRYPGEIATLDEARSAIKVMKHIRAFIRARLGLKTK